MQRSHLGKAGLWPIIHLGFAYTRLWHGIDLYTASPAAAIRSTSTPVLLIHGTSDTNIPAVESEMLHKLNPAATTLWLVPGAEHLNAMETAPAEYVKTVLGWLQSHP